MNMAASEQPPRARPSLVGPVILVGLGVIFLLNNLGVISWDIWNVLWRFWPVLLIVAGLDLLFGRRSTILSAVFALLLAAALAFGVWYFSSQGSFSSANMVVQSVTYPADSGVSRADIRLSPAVGELQIAAMSEPDGLIDGTVAIRDGERLIREYSVSNGVAYLALREEGASGQQFTTMPFENRRWDLALNPEIPTNLALNAGVNNATLDLARLNLTGLDLRAGVGSLTVTLPATGDFRATINGGVGELIVRIPAGMAARIEASQGVGGLDVAGRFVEQGDQLYVSPDFETNANRVELKVSGGVGSIRIESVVMP